MANNIYIQARQVVVNATTWRSPAWLEGIWRRDELIQLDVRDDNVSALYALAPEAAGLLPRPLPAGARLLTHEEAMTLLEQWHDVKAALHDADDPRYTVRDVDGAKGVYPLRAMVRRRWKNVNRLNISTWRKSERRRASRTSRLADQPIVRNL